MKILRILIVEDEDIEDLRPLLEGTTPKDLTGEDWDDVELTFAASQDEAESAAGKAQYQIVLLDLRYPIHPCDEPSGTPFQGMIWLPELRKAQLDAAIVILTAYPDVPNAVRAVGESHANDFVAKTEPWLEICRHIRNAWKAIVTIRQVQLLRQQEYWTILRSQALLGLVTLPQVRLQFGEVARAIRQSQTSFETIAARIESGDPTAIEEAPAQVRSASQKLWNEFGRSSDWLRDVSARDLPPVIDLVQDLLRPLPHLYGVEIDITETQESSIKLATYPSDLKISLHEVIRNALEAGATKVKVRALPAGKGASIIVKDNGPGLAPGAVDSLFKKGFTTHENDPRHRGMGLYIASSLMQDLGGTIDVRTAEDGGVVATLNVPDLGVTR